MGMYDELRVRCPLPAPDLGQNRLYQTKSLDCALDGYELREDGTFWKKEFWRVPVEPGEAPLSWERSYFTGTVRFYDFFTRDPVEARGWIEFQAVFVDGRVMDLKCVKDDRGNSDPVG